MTRDVRRAERAQAAREAARSWRRVGLLDEAAVAHVAREWPDDRRRFGPVLRTLAFGFTVFAVGATVALALVLNQKHVDDTLGIVALVLAVALSVLTEICKGPLRVCNAGLESATGLLAPLMTTIGVMWLLSQLSTGSPYTDLFALLIATAAYGAASLRWGSTVSGLVATACLGGALAQLPGARLTWVMAAVVVVPLTLRGAVAPALPLSHRRTCLAVALLALVGLYVACHLGSYDERLLESSVVFGQRELARQWVLPRGLYVVMTALVPLGVLALGLVRRRRPVILLGAALIATSLVTLRYYVHVAPLWVVLTISGAALMSLALGLRRWLHAGPVHERCGYTADELAGEERKLRLLETAVAVAAAGPAQRTEENAATSFEGGGGRSGGGGASGQF
jgi:hypothetical protein